MTAGITDKQIVAGVVKALELSGFKVRTRLWTLRGCDLVAVHPAYRREYPPIPVETWDKLWVDLFAIGRLEEVQINWQGFTYMEVEGLLFTVSQEPREVRCYGH